MCCLIVLLEVNLKIQPYTLTTSYSNVDYITICALITCAGLKSNYFT